MLLHNGKSIGEGEAATSLCQQKVGTDRVTDSGINSGINNGEIYAERAGVN